MAGATILPVPKAVDIEAHHYPRRWKRNLFFLYGGMFLMAFQISRFAHMCRVSIKSLRVLRVREFDQRRRQRFLNVPIT